MAEYTISINEAPSESDIHTLIQSLVSYNDGEAEKENWQPLAIFIRNDKSEMVGGIHGYTHWGWLFISHLWVTEVLAVVLLGIGTGGLLAAAWLGRRPADARRAGLVAAAAGAAAVASFALFDWALPPPTTATLVGIGETLRVALWLMLPVCTLSGALFGFLGHCLRAEVGEDTRAAGLLTLANTVGAMLGSLLAGFVLLPFVGVEKSIFVLACGYAGVAALAALPGRRLQLAAFGLIGVALALFPFGAMTERHVRYLEAPWQESEGYRVAAVKEGLSETVFLLRKDALGQPLTWRMLTNGMGMSTTDYRARRYMASLLVWLPVALHPEPRSALVISYGLGNTARALYEVERNYCIRRDILAPSLITIMH